MGNLTSLSELFEARSDCSNRSFIVIPWYWAVCRKRRAWRSSESTLFGEAMQNVASSRLEILAPAPSSGLSETMAIGISAVRGWLRSNCTTSWMGGFWMVFEVIFRCSGRLCSRILGTCFLHRFRKRFLMFFFKILDLLFGPLWPDVYTFGTWFFKICDLIFGHLWPDF